MQRHVVVRDDSIFQGWPDVVRVGAEGLLCVFSECPEHADRSTTRIVTMRSHDRGRSWGERQVIVEANAGGPRQGPYWNCARLSATGDGRIALVCDRVDDGYDGSAGKRENHLWLSDDGGLSWSEPQVVPVSGIVPDQLVVVPAGPHAGRWLIAAHRVEENRWVEACCWSDDQGASWSNDHTVAAIDGLQLCEGSIMALEDGTLACFLRENSNRGMGAFKTLSHDGGASWTEPFEFPIPGCHRPVAGLLQSGQVLITHRLRQGGKGWKGWWTQNTLAAWTDRESVLADRIEETHVRLFPLDYDRSPRSDCGYTGWVQFDDGEIYVVNYIVDDAPLAQIRGYSFQESEIVLPAPVPEAAAR